MARPPKKGLDYFPMQTDILSDPKIMDIIRNGDRDAWTVFSVMLILTYKDGYYSDKEMIKRTISWIFREIPSDRVEECLVMMVDAGLLDRQSFEQGALTSHGIQVQYDAAGKRRKNNPDTKYWIVSDDNNSISVNNNSVSADINTTETPFMYAESTQNKIKENKIDNNIPTYKENIVNKNIEEVGRSGQSGESGEFQVDDLEVFIPQYSELAERINKRLGKLIPLGPRELRWSASVARYYEEPYIFAAIDKGEKVLREGKLRGQFLKYVDKILQNWDDGIGAPDFVIEGEKRLAAQKAEYMKPSRFKEVFVDG